MVDYLNSEKSDADFLIFCSKIKYIKYINRKNLNLLNSIKNSNCFLAKKISLIFSLKTILGFNISYKSYKWNQVSLLIELI